MATDLQKKKIALMMGYVSGLHAAAKELEAEGLVEMDMTCCQLEDVFETLEPLLGPAVWVSSIPAERSAALDGE